MKIFSKILSIAFVFALLFSSHAFAARTTLTLPEDQVWVSISTERTGKYKTVYARLFSVYPTDGGKDNFTRIQVRVTSSSGTVMSNRITLYETNTSSTTIQLKDGTLANKKIKFQFRGNNPNYGAKADVYYYGR